MNTAVNSHPRYIVRVPYYQHGCYRIFDTEKAESLPHHFANCAKALREAAELNVTSTRSK